MRNIGRSNTYSLVGINVIILFMIALVSVNATSVTAQNNSTQIVESNSTITIPVLCNEEEECLPQFFVSIPFNQTEIKSMSATDLDNLKNMYLTTLESYLNSTLLSIKSDPTDFMDPINFCEKLPPPGCYGIIPEPEPEEDIPIPMNNTE